MALDCSAAAVWNLVRDFGAVNRWVPGIASITLSGQGVGAERHIVQTDGNTVTERLEVLDDGDKTIRYAIVTTTLPFARYQATIEVRPLGATRCEVAWSGTFDAIGDDAQVSQMLDSAYRKNVQHLAAICRGNA